MATPSDTNNPRSEANEAEPHPALNAEILEAVPDMMFRISRDGRYLGYKPARGLSPFVPPSEFLGRSVGDVLPEPVAGGAITCIEAVLSTGEPQTYLYQLPLDGEMHQYEARIVALSDDEALAVVRDVTTADRPAQTYGLTPTELAILSCLALGLTDKAIAHNRRISPGTVRTHVASIRKKMEARSRTEAAVRAVREGLLG